MSVRQSPFRLSSEVLRCRSSLVRCVSCTTTWTVRTCRNPTRSGRRNWRTAHTYAHTCSNNNGEIKSYNNNQRWFVIRDFQVLYTGTPCNVLALGLLSLEWAWSSINQSINQSWSCDVFNFWEISDNNSKTVQDRSIVSNRKSYVLYWMAMLPVILSDL